jgi:insertion element IS1 protein InsB
VLCELFRCDADEMWSYVGHKANKQWLWLVMNTAKRQIIAFHVGGRGQEDAKLLLEKVSLVFRQNAAFFTEISGVVTTSWKRGGMWRQGKRKAIPITSSGSTTP